VPSAQIIDIARFMPEKVVRAEDLMNAGDDPLVQNEWFRPPAERRFASPQYSTAELGAKALAKLIERTGIKAEDIDLILCSSVLTDLLTTGSGSKIQALVNAVNASAIQIDTGCTSYLSMLNIARAFIESGMYKKIVIVTSTNFISRLSDFRDSPKSRVLGDGASATLVVPGQASILSSYERSHGENFGLLTCSPQKQSSGEAKDYWEPGAGSLEVAFSIRMVERLRKNAIDLVAGAVKKVLSDANVQTKDVDLLVTHQPNLGLMQEWRDVIGIQKPKVFDTFNQYGNLFQGSIPVTLSEAIDQEKMKAGDLVCLGTFSNGGDFVSAMLIRWF
jgi:3-oxoacyl-[acyl-carrier-protein] synthase-3